MSAQNRLCLFYTPTVAWERHFNFHLHRLPHSSVSLRAGIHLANFVFKETRSKRAKESTLSSQPRSIRELFNFQSIYLDYVYETWQTLVGRTHSSFCPSGLRAEAFGVCSQMQWLQSSRWEWCQGRGQPIFGPVCRPQAQPADHRGHN